MPAMCCGAADLGRGGGGTLRRISLIRCNFRGHDQRYPGHRFRYAIDSI